MTDTPLPVVTPDEAGKTLAAIVRARFAVSWGQARKWIESGKIAVDGTTRTGPELKLKAGAAITRTMHAPRPTTAALLEEERVVFRDDDVIVVDKPAGVATVAYGEETGTLDERVRRLVEKQSGRRGRIELGVVHRLDKETSGLVVFTLSWRAKNALARQFREHSVHRLYLALALGDVQAARFESHLVADRGDGIRGSRERARGRVGRAGQGQLAITHVTPRERFSDATLVTCQLETGRTHQIRIHLSEAGHPVVGEPVYMRDYAGPRIFAPRLMLHAAELGFTHPAGGRDVRWQRDPPADMQAVIARLRARAKAT